MSSLSSRGTTIITQKENKGEYNGIQCWGTSASQCSGGWLGSNWYWNNSSYDWDTYAHVFDQNGKNGTTDNIPIRYENNTIVYSGNNNIPQCTSDYDNPTTLLSRTKGLYGNDGQKKIINQYSCKPNTLNASNLYNFPAATAGSNNASTSSATNMPNSICPKGWQLPPNSNNKSFNTLIRTASDIYASPLSFVRLGYYNYGYGSVDNRGNDGVYWSSTAYSSVRSYYLNFLSGSRYPQDSDHRAFGCSIRCVAR